MPEIIVTIIALTLCYLLLKTGFRYGDEVFRPDKKLLKAFNIKGKEMFFNGKELFESDQEYILSFNKDVFVENNDTIHFSYNMNRGKIEGIREIFVNNICVWTYNERRKNEISLIEIKQ